MDGFDNLGKTKIIMATNRPDTLDPALLRPGMFALGQWRVKNTVLGDITLGWVRHSSGRLDRKIEIPLPNEMGRLEIMKIHSQKIAKKGDIGM